MSSDYLNFELSKELHDLGAVFEGASRYWGIPWIDPGELSSPTPMLLYPGSDMDSHNFSWQICDNKIPAPSTAQLIDEINKKWGCLFEIRFRHTNPFKDYGWVCTYRNDEVAQDDDCATTALGKALIALVKEDRK